MKALFDNNPNPRYLIVPTQEQAYWTINRAIERMVEQNHDQKYSYDREALIEMLDAALAKLSGEVVQKSIAARQIFPKWTSESITLILCHV